MSRLHMPDDTSSRLVGIDVQCVQELAVTVQRGTVLHGVRQGRFNTEIEKPGVDVGSWGVSEDIGKGLGDVWMHD